MLKFKKAELCLLALASLMAWGCAPAQKYSTSAPTNRMASLKSAQTGSGGVDANWRCPASYNVLLKDNIGLNGFDYTGNGSFTACVGRSDSSMFRVTGVTTSSNICIYPLRSSGSGLTLVEQPRCFSVTGSPIEADFTATDINYFAIVDGNYTQQMTACLSGPTPCPSHSEGFVQ